jgi:hypothetical protein
MSLTGAVFTAGSDGSFAGDVPVSRRVFTTSGPADCLADGCRLVAETPTSGRVEAVIEFDPSAPLPPSPSLAVSPAGPYQPGQAVRVTGSGMPANTQVDIAICAGDPEIDPGERRCVNVAGGSAHSDAQGGFTIGGFPVLAHSGGIDCLAEPRGCYLAYAPSHFPVVARSSIAFAR